MTGQTAGVLRELAAAAEEFKTQALRNADGNGIAAAQRQVLAAKDAVRQRPPLRLAEADARMHAMLERIPSQMEEMFLAGRNGDIGSRLTVTTLGDRIANIARQIADEISPPTATP